MPNSLAAPQSAGLHHITAIAGDPVANARFYRDALGLRMVKKTVNFDDPTTYHLYYGDETGTPGTILTFFPWPNAQRGRPGPGQAVEIGFAIPRASLGFWIDRLQALNIASEAPVKRFGETVIGFKDPDGLHLELVATETVEAIPGWAGGPVPAEHAIRGFSGQTLWAAKAEPTAQVLETVFGYRKTAEEGAFQRYEAPGVSAGGLGRRIDIRVVGGFPRGSSGAGTIHHIAFRAIDDGAQANMARALAGLGHQATQQLDRNYFRSVYFREPGHVLFEIATDAPGFGVDEPVATLGQKLQLPPWLEPHRKAIEAALPPVSSEVVA